VHDLQRLVPAPLELTGTRRLAGSTAIVLPARMRGSKRARCSASSRCRLAADVSPAWASSALTAASMPSGFKTRNTSVLTASSTRMPPNEMQRSCRG